MRERAPVLPSKQSGVIMPKSEKPKRRYKPGPIVKPLKARNDWVMEGDVHAALLAIKAGQVLEDHLAMLASHADLVRRLETAPFHAQRQGQTIVRILSDVLQRKPPAVTELEQAAIRAAVQVTLPAVRQADNHAIHRAAQAAWFAYQRDGGVKVDI